MLMEKNSIKNYFWLMNNQNEVLFSQIEIYLHLVYL